MISRSVFVIAALMAIAGCDRPTPTPPNRDPEVEPDVDKRDEAIAPADEHPGVPGKEDEAVTVVCETKFYVEGSVRGNNIRLFTDSDMDRMWRVDGVVLEVVRPPEYAGQIVTMHHDGMLASGDPSKLFAIGRRYELRIGKVNIGRFDFAPCTLHGTRKLVDK